MKVVAVINTTAGSTGPGAEMRMKDALRAVGVHHAHVVQLDRALPARQLQELSAGQPDFLFVWGGDGTHRTALNAIGREPSNVVLLPGGVRNLLSRSLHGTGDWERIVSGVLQGARSRAVPGGVVDDEMFFFCALLAGAPALFANAREGLRDGDLFGALNSASRGFWAIEKMLLQVRVGVQPAAATGRLHTSFVSALVGRMASNARMEMVTLKNPEFYSGLDVIWSSFQEGFQGNSDVDIAPVDEFVVAHPAGEDVPAVADGEPLGVGAEFTVRFVQHAAHTLVAR